MKFLAIFELAMAAAIGYIAFLQLQIGSVQRVAGVSTTSSHLMAGGSLIAALLLVAVALHALRTNRAHRGTHALPFIILALTASASLFVGRAA